jgi:hypothetical protein
VSIILMMTLIASLSFQKIYSPNDVSEIYKKAVNVLAVRNDDHEGLAADTLVKTPDGYKPISEILVGETVVCFDLISKQVCESKVISVDSVFSNKCQGRAFGRTISSTLA